jgi:hypothetical protein
LADISIAFGIYQATIIGLLLAALGVGTILLLQGIPTLLVVYAFIQGVDQILLFPVVAFYLPALVYETDLDTAAPFVLLPSEVVWLAQPWVAYW